MRKYILIFILCAVVSIPASAQKKKPVYRFSSFNSFMLMNGGSTTAAALQSVNGFKKNRWFAGIGAGLDYYLYRSIPVFINVSREFGTKKNKLFVFAGAGMNIQWVQEEFDIKPIWWDPNQRNRFHNGFYTDAGAGVAFGLKNGHAVVMSLGHSLKTMKEKVWYTDWRTNQPAEDIYNYTFSRVALKMGWRF